MNVSGRFGGGLRARSLPAESRASTGARAGFNRIENSCPQPNIDQEPNGIRNQPGSKLV
jgi:hypothetical protein